MKRRVFLPIFAGLLLASGGVFLLLRSNAGPRSIGDGVTHEIVRHVGQTFRVVRVDVTRSPIRTIWKRDDGSRVGNLMAARANAAASGRRVLFATNAGIFSPDRTPLGLYVEDGRELVPLNMGDGSGNFYMKPNGVFAIGSSGVSVETAERYVSHPETTTAVQSGPTLVIDGVINPQFSPTSANRNTRSAVGVCGDGQVVFVLSESPVTFHEIATLYRDRLGCANALYLDGAISRFFVDGIDQANRDDSFAAMFVVTNDGSATHGRSAGR